MRERNHHEVMVSIMIVMVKLMKKFVMAREQTQVSVNQALVESYHKFMAKIL